MPWPKPLPLARSGDDMDPAAWRLHTATAARQSHAGKAAELCVEGWPDCSPGCLVVTLVAAGQFCLSGEQAPESLRGGSTVGMASGLLQQGHRGALGVG